jgi:hypothetical protein
MSIIIHIKVFNDILDQFFDYLENEFIEFKSDIILTRSGVQFVRQGNPRLVVEQFMNMVNSFRNQIQNCDEDFFLNYQLNSNVISNENSMLCMKIKKIWMSDSINDIQKANIWLNFQKLIKAGDKILNRIS